MRWGPSGTKVEKEHVEGDGGREQVSTAQVDVALMGI